MGLFSNLIAKEDSQAQTKVVAPISATTAPETSKIKPEDLQKTNPVVENLMHQAVLNASAMINSNTSEKKTTSLSEALKNTKMESVKAETKIEVAPITIPEQAPQISIIPEVKAEIAPITEVIEKKEEAKLENTEQHVKVEVGETPERIFVDVFLREVKDILESGKELEKANEERMINAKKNEEKVAEGKSLRANAEKIEETLKAYLDVNEDENLRNKLNEILQSYQNYMELFDKKIQDEAKAQRVYDNTLLTKINSRKAEIAKLLKEIGGENGGQMIFERVKNYIRSSEAVAQTKNIDLEKVSKKTVNEVKAVVVQAVADDFHGVKMLVEGASVLDILTRLYANTK